MTALASKRAARKEPISSRLIHLAIMVTAFALIFSPTLHLGALTWRFLPAAPATAWIGLALTAAGCAFAVWARLLLGGNWSASVTVKQDHRLIRRGPYNIVRHPIYSGFLLALAGTAVALGELRGILGVALAFIGWSMKARLEESYMIEQFGQAYRAYQSQVNALIPVGQGRALRGALSPVKPK